MPAHSLTLPLGLVKKEPKTKKYLEPNPESFWYFVESDSLMETIQNTHHPQL